MHRRTLAGLVAGLTLAAVTGCGSNAAPADEADADPGVGKDHGAVAGAQEVAEPQLHLTTIDGAGNVAQLDLIEGSSAELGRIGEPSEVDSDGRYLFATTAAGMEIVDSGMWTWDHGDHFHYYRGGPRLLGTVEGGGEATVATGPLSTAGSTGVFFHGTGEAVLLDNEALADGEVRELFRIDAGSHDGLIAPIGDGALVTVADGGATTGIRYHDADGNAAEEQTACVQASGTIATKVGVVVGCADGAVLATETDGRIGYERIPYPSEAPRATRFEGRKSRPTVAALSGTTGIWLLDTRERSWTHLDAGVPLRQVVAADDEEGHVLALDTTGRVRVYAAGNGKQLAATEPLVDPGDGHAGVGLVVDQERAYLNVPAEGVVHEIDYADDARIARTLETPTAPTFFTETGR